MNEKFSVLQNYNGKSVNEVFDELGQIKNWKNGLWSTRFLEHFNKICKHEKKKEKNKK